MAPGRGSTSLRDPELYEELRDDGASEENAARISNVATEDTAATGKPSLQAETYCDEPIDPPAMGCDPHR